jgi:putative ABC transport system permease protein
MNLALRIREWFRALLRKEQLDKEMDEELQFHLEEQTRENIQAGMSPAEARAAALRAFGGMEQVKEACRELRGVGWLETLWQDVRFGTRMIRRNPGFAGVVVLLLAIGIGASTTMFSVVEAVFLGGSPYRDPKRLVWVYETNPAKNDYHLSPSGPTFQDWREQNHVFEQVAADLRGYNCRVKTADGMDRSRAVIVSAEFFSALGVKPALGRTFLAEETRVGSERVVMLSHSHWQRWFNGDPAVIGKTLTIDGEVHTVVGVLPADFRWVFQPVLTGLWLPYKPAERADRANRGVMALARLKPGVTLAQAQAEMEVIAKRLARAYPETNAGIGALVVPFDAAYSNWSKRAGNPGALWLLFGIVNAVLVIGCLNVANLLLIRAAGREREMAIRTALGSGRLRLLRQLLTENALLAALGGLLGVVLAYWTIELVSGLRGQALPWNFGSLLERYIPWFVEVRLDGRALLYALTISVLTCGFFGLGPALRAAQSNLSRSLAGGQTAGGSGRFRKGLALLVVSEVAIACVLLVGAALLVNSAVRLQAISPGFNPKKVVWLCVRLPDPPYASESEQKRCFEQLLERIKGLPGVQEAAIGGRSPAGGGGSNWPTLVEGEESGEVHREIRFVPASRGHFRVLQVPLLRGRLFTDRDDETAPPVVIINEAAARRYWPGGNPLGRHLTVQRAGTNSVSFEVVGVVGNVYYYQEGTADTPEAHTCWLQHGASFDMDLAIRTTADPRPMKALLQSAIRAVDEDIEIYRNETLEEGISHLTWSWSRQFNTFFLSGFAAFAFVLASIGVYGVTAFSVAQRTHEIGIRMALGAQRHDVLGMVLRQGATLAAVGIGLGGACALGLTRLVRSMLFGITPTDPLTFGLIALLVGAVAFVACWFPARRAANLDPVVALRYE